MDLVVFETPIGPSRLRTLPQGWTQDDIERRQRRMAEGLSLEPWEENVIRGVRATREAMEAELYADPDEARGARCALCSETHDWANVGCAGRDSGRSRAEAHDRTVDMEAFVAAAGQSVRSWRSCRHR